MCVHMYVQELMVSFQSYMNKMSIVLSGDEDYFPNLDQLCDDIVESIRSITKSIKEKEELAKQKLEVVNVKEKDN